MKTTACTHALWIQVATTALLKRLTIGALIGLLVPVAGTLTYCLQEGPLTLHAILQTQVHVTALWYADLAPLLSAYGWLVASTAPEASSSLRSSDLLRIIAAITSIPILLLIFATVETRVAMQKITDVELVYSIRADAAMLASNAGQAPAARTATLGRIGVSVRALEARDRVGTAQIAPAWKAFNDAWAAGVPADSRVTARFLTRALDCEGALKRRLHDLQFQAAIILVMGTFGLIVFLIKCYKIVMHLRLVEERIAWQNNELETRNTQLEEQKDELRGREEELSMTADSLSDVNQLLQQASHRFEELFQSLPVACFCFDASGRIFEWNRTSETQYGLTTDQAFQRTLWDAVGLPEDAERVQEITRRVFEGEVIEGVEWTHVRADGSLCNILCSMFPLRGAEGEVAGAISANVDITDLTRAQEHLRDSEERFRSAIHSMQEGLLLIDREHTVRLSNHAAERIFGTDGATLVGRQAEELNWKFVGEDGADMSLEQWPASISLNSGIAQHEVVTGLQRPGGLIWLSTNCAPLFHTGDPEPYSVVVTVTDITQRKQYEKKLKEQMVMLNDAHAKLEMQQAELLEANARLRALATLDGLTGLKNHRSFQERLDLEQQRAARYNIPLSLIFLDVDKFKTYNDTYGHPAGDEVLKTVARTLQNEARVTDFVARYGGEEFAIILTNTDYAGSLVVAERFRAAIETACWKERLVTASFGVTTMLPARQTAASLISEADKALYWSKQHGRNRVAHLLDLSISDSPLEEVSSEPRRAA
ncbi:MAG: diguanylate cyclase [Capsulimonadaceae bacterium]|nr:diguanylate cyclase [Capsulimonadaceae bacterium]